MSKYPSIIRIQHIRRINHLGELDKKGGMTIAYKYDFNRYGNGKGDSTVLIATALCSNNDVFRRAKGRTQAIENFEMGNTVLLPVRNRDVHTLMELFRLFLCEDMVFDLPDENVDDHDSADTVENFHAKVKEAVDKFDTPGYGRLDDVRLYQSPDCCGESRKADSTDEDHGTIVLRL